MVAVKMVAFVTAGYPSDHIVSFEAAVRAGTVSECISGAAVVRCGDRAVAGTISHLLGD